ncbi:MAG: hypothetical protein ACREJ4_04160 [Candidatus Methylomirabilaceae bacterium]
MHSNDKALRDAHRLELYKRRRVPLTIKIRAVRTYLAGASLRGTAFAMRFDYPFSHEAVRQWAHRIAHLFRPTRQKRKTVIVDETTLHDSSGKDVFEWVAIDDERRHVILVWTTRGRGGLEALLFMKAVLRRCRNRPFVMVDRGCWYPWALTTLGLSWKVQRGGPRSLVESYFGSLKHRLTRMTRRPRTWHTTRSLTPLLALHAWNWNEAR